MKQVFAFLIVISCTVFPSFAQQAEQGLYPGISYDSDLLGNVNLTTGSLAIDSVVIQLPQWKGFSLGTLHLKYNSPVWALQMYTDNDGNYDAAQWMPSSNSNFSIYPSIDGPAQWAFTTIPDYDGNPSAQDLQVATPDGDVHDLVPVGNGYRSIDGTNLSANSTATQITDADGTVESITVPGGTLVPPPNGWAMYGSSSYPMIISNVHGQSMNPNTLPGGNCTYPCTFEQGPDSIGRVWIMQETADYSGCSGPVAITDAWVYSDQDQNGTKHPVLKECMVKIPLATAFGDCHGFDPCDYSDVGSPNYTFVQSIVFTSDGTWNAYNAWTFLYGRTDFSSSDYVNYGWLTSIQTPHGGTVTYSWNPTGGSSLVQSRTLNAGDGSGDRTTTYSYGFSNPRYAVVTNPDSTTVTHQFDFNTLAETGTVYSDQNGNTMKTVTTTYQSVLDPFNSSQGIYPVYYDTFVTSKTTSWPNGVSCETQQSPAATYNYSITFAEWGNPNPPTISGSAPSSEVASSSIYDCSSGGNPPLLSTTQSVWMDIQNSNYSNNNLVGLPQQGSVYDGSGNLTSQTTFSYDQNGESGYFGDLTTTSQWLDTGGSISTSSYYDSTGQVTSSVDPSGNATHFGYDSTDLAVISVTEPPVPSGVTLQRTSTPDPFTYMTTGQTDIAGATSTQQYDNMFRPATGQAANGASFSFTYVPPGTGQLPTTILTQQIDTNGNTSSMQTVTDGFGRTLQTSEQTNNGSQAGWYQQDTCYDSMGRVSFQSYPYVTWSTTPAVHTCAVAGDTFSYDALSRPIKTTHQDGTYSTTSYSGRATQTTDEMGVSKISQIDGLGRLMIVCEISSNSSMPGSGSPESCGTDISGTGFVTTYAYNLANHTTTITQGAQQRVFQTDSLGRPIYSSEPESGVTTYAYSYNSTGLQTVRTKPRANQTSSAVYTTTTTQTDPVGRTIAITYANSDNQGYVTPPKVFAYDTLYSAAPGSLGYSYGRMVLASTGYTSTQLGGYDGLGDVGTTRQCLPDWCGQSAHDVTMSYQYDLRGLMTQQQYMTQGSSGTTVTVNTARNISGDISYVSGGQNNVSTLLDPNNNPILIQTTQLGAYGPISGKFGNTLGIGIAYDSMGRIQGESVCDNGATSCSGASQVYAFSSLGWTGGYLNASNDSALGQSSSYSYDEFGRLKSMNIGSGTMIYSYQYDRYGNRWQQSATGSGSGPQPSFSFTSANNQLVGNTYDAAGDVLNDGVHSYLYDAEGNVVSVDCLAQYVYNASNHRVKAISSTGAVERVAFNLNGQRASTWDASGNLLTANYYADGQPIAYYSSADAHIHFEHQDWEGTERVRTTYAGTVEGVFASLPFGDGSGTSGADGDPYHFAQLDFDSDSYTDHAQARQYSSTQGRWMSPDPYGGSYDPGDPQSMNRYVYAANNPLSTTDPSGLWGCDEAPPMGSGHSCYNGWQDIGGEQTGSRDDSPATQAPGDRRVLDWLADLINFFRGSFGGSGSTAPAIGGGCGMGCTWYSGDFVGGGPDSGGGQSAQQQSQNQTQPANANMNVVLSVNSIVPENNGAFFVVQWDALKLDSKGAVIPHYNPKTGLYSSTPAGEIKLIEDQGAGFTTKYSRSGDVGSTTDNLIAGHPPLLQRWTVGGQPVRAVVGGTASAPKLAWTVQVTMSRRGPVYSAAP